MDCATVRNILLWREPAKSALVFGCGNLAFFLISFGGYSLITLLSYVSLLHLLSGFFYFNGSRAWAGMQGSAMPRVPEVPALVAQEQVSPLVECVTSSLNNGAKGAVDLACCRDNVSSLKAIVAVYLLSVIGKMISISGLVYIAFVVAFSAPRIYEEKKTEIDGVLDTARTKLQEVQTQVMAVLPEPIKAKLCGGAQKATASSTETTQEAAKDEQAKKEE